MLPEAVLQQAADEMLDWHGSGLSVMEMSHRGAEFGEIITQAEKDLRELLKIPKNFHILFMQGGGWGENAIAPMNLSRGQTVDFVVTGAWSKFSSLEAQKYCRVNIAASAESSGFQKIPDAASWQLSSDAAYVHICANETIHGIEYQEIPDLQALGCNAPLIMDCSSNILSRPMDWDRIGMAYAGAQKNIGPAGLTLVIIRDDLLGRALPDCPSAFDYKKVADNGSMFNTPPTYSIYIAGLVFSWLKAQGGVDAMEAKNRVKADQLYQYLDGSALYENRVHHAYRSRMNIPFFLKNETLNDAFLAGAKSNGLLQLKGHRSLGGMRASIFNAMPLSGVEALIRFMTEFASQHG